MKGWVKILRLLKNLMCDQMWDRENNEQLQQLELELLVLMAVLLVISWGAISIVSK